MNSKIKKICEDLNLDPRMGYIIDLRGKLYITAAGLQQIAAQSPDLNGIEVEIITQDWENHFFLVKAKVFRKGCDHAFEDFSDSEGSQLKGGNKLRHTITRARSRAIRSAFAVPFCTIEELDDSIRFGKGNGQPQQERFAGGNDPKAEAGIKQAALEGLQNAAAAAEVTQTEINYFAARVLGSTVQDQKPKIITKITSRIQDGPTDHDLQFEFYIGESGRAGDDAIKFWEQYEEKNNFWKLIFLSRYLVGNADQ